jgi:hypothetical protein
MKGMFSCEIACLHVLIGWKGVLIACDWLFTFEKTCSGRWNPLLECEGMAMVSQRANPTCIHKKTS